MARALPSTTPGSARRRAGPCALAPAPTAARGGRAAACRRAEGAPALPAAEEAVVAAAVARRGVLRGLGGLGGLGAAAAFPAAEARAAGAPKGFNVVKNPAKGYGTRGGTRRAGAAALRPRQEAAAAD